MAYVTKKRTVFNYQSPVAMYHDNKSANKTIMGLLDYQRDMLEEYMKQYSAKNIAIEKGRIQIRPWVAPTMTHAPFSKAKQRILMSATLGNSGELERVTGISRITTVLMNIFLERHNNLLYSVLLHLALISFMCFWMRT